VTHQLCRPAEAIHLFAITRIMEPISYSQHANRLLLPVGNNPRGPSLLRMSRARILCGRTCYAAAGRRKALLSRTVKGNHTCPELSLFHPFLCMCEWLDRLMIVYRHRITACERRLHSSLSRATPPALLYPCHAFSLVIFLAVPGLPCIPCFRVLGIFASDRTPAFFCCDDLTAEGLALGVVRYGFSWLATCLGHIA